MPSLTMPVDMLATLREATIATLLAANTDAADRVEAERIDPTPSGDTPRLIVLADDTAQGESLAGTAPRFRVTGTIIVQCLVEAAHRADAIDRLDALVSQVKQALFCDPAWVKLTEAIVSYQVVRSFKDGAGLIVGDAKIVVTTTWRETYPPNVTTPLLIVTLSPLPVMATGATPLAPTRDDGLPAVSITLPT